MKRSQALQETWRAVRHTYSAASYAKASRSKDPIPLTQIMNRQGSDKGTVHGYWNGLFVGHAYTDVYETRFEPLRNQPITMLEVGIGPGEPGVRRGSWLSGGRRGGSSAGWREYFTQGDIHAMDILECSWLDGDRLTTHVGDQSSRDSLAGVLKEIGKPLDIIIDDGSHQSGHQQLTLACLFPALTDDGTYVIEDLGWQPEEPEDLPKTIDLLRTLQTHGTFDSPVLDADERAMIERTVVVESLHLGSRRHPGELAILRKRP